MVKGTHKRDQIQFPEAMERDSQLPTTVVPWHAKPFLASRGTVLTHAHTHTQIYMPHIINGKIKG